MKLTKQDTQMAKGIAILGMVMLHLFCRLSELPYTPLLWVGETPLIYYFGLFGDICVPIYCFCSGYAHYLMYEKLEASYKNKIPGKLLRILLNYWIVVIIFSILGLFFDKTGTVPGTFSDFIGNMFLYDMNYNGAWWFMMTYIILLLLSPLFTKLANKLPIYILLPLSLGIYFIAYIFRFKYVLEIQNPILNWLWNQTILLGTSQIGYVFGMITYKYDVVEKLRVAMNKCTLPKPLKIIMITAIPIIAFLGHCIVQSLFVAPFTASCVLFWLYLIEPKRLLKKVLMFFGKHSTNIWLTHMFFYLVIFKDLVFIAKYPLLIIMLMLGICVICSYIIDLLYKPLLKLIKSK